MLFTSHNTPHITLGNEQCLKLFLEFATVKRGAISYISASDEGIPSGRYPVYFYAVLSEF